MRIAIALVLCLTPLVSAAPIPKGAAKPTWVGKPAFVKSPDVTLTLTLPNGNTRAIKPPNGVVSYIVKEVKDDTVEVLYGAANPFAGVPAPLPRVANTVTKAHFRKDDVLKAAEAIDHYTAKLKDNPKDAYYLQARAEACTVEEKYDAADADYSKLVEQSPTDANLIYKRATFRLAAKKFQGAIDDYDAYEKLVPGSQWSVLQWKANAKAGMKKFDEAIADLTKLVNEGPNRTSALLTRGLMYSRCNKPDKAIADYDEILSTNPDNAVAVNNKAWTLCTANVDKIRDGKKAVELATRACELTQWQNAGYIDTLAAAYAEAGDFEKAVKYQTQVLEDAELVKREGQELKDRLELFKQKKPYRLPDETKLEAKPK
jgi:tetratricopeptide (TPR) repeat protein